MVCYSYTSGDSIFYSNNVEVVYTVTALNYSFSSLAWLCEFPVNDQLDVFYRTDALGTEVLKTEITDYVINTSLNRIEFVNQPAGGQIVIRRHTPSDKMLFKFVDGAKITATQMNASLHQLLFMVQEKEFAGSTLNYYNSFAGMVLAWDVLTAYTAGTIVSYSGTFWNCILGVTGGAVPPSNGTNWLQIFNSPTAFIISGGPTPVAVNLSALTPGAGLIWNGSSFVAGLLTSSLAALTDVTLTGLASSHLLRYNGADWVNIAPTCDLTLSQIKFADHVFLTGVSPNSYHLSSPLDVSTVSQLTGFKNGAGNWVFSTAPTVYHIVKKILPAEADPVTYFANVTTSLDAMAANISNPVKIKLHWDLNLWRQNLVDYATGENLASTSSAFWDSPEELYSISGYELPTAGTPIKYHAVQLTNASGNNYRVSPYFYQVLDSANVQTGLVSKVSGYGVHRFYLSIPECSTSCLSDIPAVSAINTYYSTSTISAPDLKTALIAVGDESIGSVRDYYLMGLRDLAFAAARINPGAASTIKEKDGVSRFKKGYLLTADYNVLEDKSFKRLESSEGSANVYWKIPKQIIYYNKAALALADNAATSPLTTGTTPPINTVRFTGSSAFRGTTNPTGSTVTGVGQGVYHKADEFWSSWCVRWSTDADLTVNKHFNEADIDWLVKGVTQSATDINLFNMTRQIPEYSFGSSPGLSATSIGAYWAPWAFRPNEIRNKFSGTFDSYGMVGTHLLNIDANCLFSTASNFIPDPEDEYVFRVVAKKALTPFFKNVANSILRSSVICEYGFTDHLHSCEDTVVSDKIDIFHQGSFLAPAARALSRLDESKVRVFVKQEQIESDGGNERYVLTLSVVVPRLKSIGYAKVFRKHFPASTTNAYPQYASASADTESDSGPWNFGDPNTQDITVDSALVTRFYDGAGVADSWVAESPTTFATADYSAQEDNAGVSRLNTSIVSGRNECAVKFTRLGIPGNLWIRLSVLATDGSLDIINLLDSDKGFHTSCDE